MAYLLRFDGSDDNVDLTSPISATGDGVLAEIDFVYQGASNHVICGGTSFSDYWRIDRDSQFRISIAGSASILTINTPLVIGERYTLRLVRTGSSVVVEDESGVALTPAANFNSNPFVIDKIGSFHNGSSNLVMDLYGFKANNGANNYSPSASNGTGQILPDTVVGNDGTLVNFPTDNSQWIFYDDGGGAVEQPVVHEFSGIATVNTLASAQAEKRITASGDSLVTTTTTSSASKIVQLSGQSSVTASSVSMFEKRGLFSGNATVNVTSESYASKVTELSGNATVNVVASGTLIDGNFEIHSFSGGALITATATGQAVKIGLVSGGANITTSTSAQASKTSQLSGNATISTSTQSLFSKIASISGNAKTRVTTLASAFKRVTLSGASRVFASAYGTFFNTESNVEAYELTVQGRVKAPIVVQGTIKSLTIQGRVK